jgi:hypothetical protein
VSKDFLASNHGWDVSNWHVIIRHITKVIFCEILSTYLERCPTPITLIYIILRVLFSLLEIKFLSNFLFMNGHVQIVYTKIACWTKSETNFHFLRLIMIVKIYIVGMWLIWLKLKCYRRTELSKYLHFYNNYIYRPQFKTMRLWLL